MFNLEMYDVADSIAYPTFFLLNDFVQALEECCPDKDQLYIPLMAEKPSDAAILSTNKVSQRQRIERDITILRGFLRNSALRLNYFPKYYTRTS